MKPLSCGLHNSNVATVYGTYNYSIHGVNGHQCSHHWEASPGHGPGVLGDYELTQ
jgi:hypothetical protein